MSFFVLFCLFVVFFVWGRVGGVVIASYFPRFSRKCETMKCQLKCDARAVAHQVVAATFLKDKKQIEKSEAEKLKIKAEKSKAEKLKS